MVIIRHYSDITTDFIHDYQGGSTVAGLLVESETTKDTKARDGERVTLKLWGRKDTSYTVALKPILKECKFRFNDRHNSLSHIMENILKNPNTSRSPSIRVETG